jgi:hypothetical protein
MLARFLYEVVELRLTCAVFLDGFNEFASIRYGGRRTISIGLQA